MKIAILFTLILLSLNSFAKEDETAASIAQNSTKKKSKKSKTLLKTPAVALPCDSKEDILKKLEEEKKKEAEKGKGFSLQGGNTGCSVK